VENLLQTGLSGASLSPADRGLCQELVYGIVRCQATLDWLIARKTEGRQQKPSLQILLRLGLYQMFWLDRIPDHAAVNETVELGKQFGFVAQAGFLNAVLRGYVRERTETKKLLEKLKTDQPHLGFSHPEWLVERWRKRWGDEKTFRLLDWNNTAPPTYARVNSLKTNAATLVAEWKSEGVEFIARQRKWTGGDLVFELSSYPPLASLPSFQQGLFYVQDPSTLLAVQKLDPQPGETILDLCAAPGGKTTFLAQRMQNRGRIVAADVSESRVNLIRENCIRLGATCVETISISTFNSQPSTFYDRILVDVPCSNTGVMRRRVELRWRIRPEEIERLRAAQPDLLNQAAPQVKPGGVLVYSTCSLEPEENQEVVERFRNEHADFKLERERELLPFADGVDGAYVALFSRGT
jgi:16S rRNA (cytosine967-C5)-methyltransferase